MAKQSLSKKATAKKPRKNHKLSPMEKELLACCKDHQPVLLYGDDKIGREDLLRSIHKSAELTLKRINLAFFDSSLIYNLLAYQYRENPIEATPSDYLDEDIFPYNEGCFYCCDGILFLDNLECNEENKSIYHKLAAHIQEGNTRYKWLVVYTHRPGDLPSYLKEQFKLISLDSEEAVSVSDQKKVDESKEQKVKSLKNTLSYNKTTGKFRFGGKESLPISPTSRHKVRIMAEKLMKCWEKGKPCPQSKIVRDTRRKTPRSIYDNTTTIRNTLKSNFKVNMPQSSNDEYLPPEEPNHFKIVS